MKKQSWWFTTSRVLGEGGSNTEPQTQTTRRNQRKRQHSRLIVGKFNKRADLHTRLTFGSCKTVDLWTHQPESLRVYIERPLLGSAKNPVQMVSITQYSLKTGSLKQPLGGGTLGGRSIPRTGEEPVIAPVQFTGQPEVTSPPWLPPTKRHASTYHVTGTTTYLYGDRITVEDKGWRGGHGCKIDFHCSFFLLFGLSIIFTFTYSTVNVLILKNCSKSKKQSLLWLHTKMSLFHRQCMISLMYLEC